VPEKTGVPPITSGLHEITGVSIQTDYPQPCNPRNCRDVTITMTLRVFGRDSKETGYLKGMPERLARVVEEFLGVP
jgi:hypothetical protein